MSQVIFECPTYLEDYLKVKADFLVTYAANISSLISTYVNQTGANSSLVDESDLWYFWDKVISEVRQAGLVGLVSRDMGWWGSHLEGYVKSKKYTRRRHCRCPPRYYGIEDSLVGR